MKPTLLPSLLLSLLLVLIAPLSVAAQRSAPADTGKVLFLTVAVVNGVPSHGSAYDLTCRAVPGSGNAQINNTISSDLGGNALKQSFLAALTVLRADRTIPGGPVDYHRFDLVYEVSNRYTQYSQGSGAVAAGLTGYAAMTGRGLRDRLAVTGDVSIDGSIKPVGGISYKLPAAIEAGASMILIPAGNFEDAMRLPLSLRLKTPIFPVKTLAEAIYCGIAPTDPAARSFNSYLALRDRSIQNVVSYYEEGLRRGEYQTSIADYLPNIEATYNSYFAVYPQAGGSYNLSDIQALSDKYPLDIGLRSVLLVARRIRMARASVEEAARGAKAAEEKQYESALAHYKLANELNPGIREYQEGMLAAERAQVEITLKPTIQAAEEHYKEKRFRDAEREFHSLAATAGAVFPQFAALEQIANARAHAAEHADDVAAHRLAADVARRYGYADDSAEEYRLTWQLEASPANLKLYLDERLLATAKMEPSARRALLQREVKDLHAVVAKAAVAAQPELFRLLGEALREAALNEDAVSELEAAYAKDQRAEVVVPLARTYIERSAQAQGAEKEELRKKALFVLEHPANAFYRNEALYELRETLEKSANGDGLYPFLRLDTASSPDLERPVKGALQFSVYARAAGGIRSIEVACDGRLCSEVPLSEFRRGQVNVRWDSAKEPDGPHRLEVFAVGANGKRMRLPLTLSSKNRMIGTVWGDTETHTYHLPTCNHAPQIMRREVFKAEDDALRYKYKPCFRCIK